MITGRGEGRAAGRRGTAGEGETGVAGSASMRRVSSVRGQCSAQAHSVPPVGDSVDETHRSDALVTGTFSNTGTASTSATGTSEFPGNSASCTGTGTQSDTLAIEGSSLSLTFDGDTNGTATASFNGDHGSSGGTGIGNALALVNFRVEGASVPYSLQGDFSVSLGGSGSSSFNQTVDLRRRFPNGSAQFLAGFERRGDHSAPVPGPHMLNQSGTLVPGKYEFFVSLGCSAHGYGTTTGSGPNANCSSNGDLTLEVGP